MNGLVGCLKNLVMITNFLFTLYLATINAKVIRTQADTLFLDKKQTCWIVNNNSNSAYYLHKYDSVYSLSNKISYKGGEKALEQYLRMMYYTEISPDCVALNITYILIFTPQKKLKNIYFIQIPRFLDSYKLKKHMKKWLKRKDMWIIKDGKIDYYFYLGTLRML